jgi:preprotein translocase subunit SecG
MGGVYLRGLDSIKMQIPATHLMPAPGSISMMDVVMLTIAFVFFAVSIAYVYACERL